ncbi:helix-turn-helix domain-containing protein [Brevibacterium oceani]|uniref:helix-turn-helix domain-containing protein n=1 Tax=Brevibacterium oceani TaxID=358099 RepID=UPI00359C2FA1
MHSAANSQATLAPVLASGRARELLDSLGALIDTTTIAQAAVRLRVHRNTVRAHREELEGLLGLDLGNGADRSLCALALAASGR